jgi:hypothetical protein
MPTDTSARRTSPGGNLYVGPSLVASLAGVLVSLSHPTAPAAAPEPALED